MTDFRRRRLGVIHISGPDCKLASQHQIQQPEEEVGPKEKANNSESSSKLKPLKVQRNPRLDWYHKNNFRIKTISGRAKGPLPFPSYSSHHLTQKGITGKSEKITHLRLSKP